jgi:hypothetical protein
MKIMQKLIETSARISSELKGVILAFHSSTLSMRKIVDQLLVMGKTFTISTFHSVITQKKEEDLGHLKSRIRLATHQRPLVITKSFLKKPDVKISEPYPLTIEQFS